MPMTFDNAMNMPNAIIRFERGERLNIDFSDLEDSEEQRINMIKDLYLSKLWQAQIGHKNNLGGA